MIEYFGHDASDRESFRLEGDWLTLACRLVLRSLGPSKRQDRVLRCIPLARVGIHLYVLYFLKLQDAPGNSDRTSGLLAPQWS